MRAIYKFVLILFISLAIALPGQSYAAGTSDACATKYPIILAHGTGGAAEMMGIVDYWWGIPEALRNEGAEVYVTSVNGMDGTDDKARQFKAEFDKIKASCDAEKFNIIGHSHGALYTRYAISNLEIAENVASYTSIAGPHHGMFLADALVQATPELIQQLSGKTLDFVYAYFFGNTQPDTLANLYDVTTRNMQDVFNPKTPDMPGIHYQSYAAKVKLTCPNPVLEPTWLFLLSHEGPNDGLVSVESAKWGDFQGAETGAWWSPGCDHLAIIGQMFGMTPGFNAPEFYVDMVCELKKNGY
ncbi:MAG: esterase/lipase family protein [Desulfobacterales bacterium]